MLKRIFLLLILCCVVHETAFAARLANVFSDHMVLQQSKPLPIWGSGEPGEVIKVEFQNQTVTTTADASGAWKVTLKPVPAGGPYELVVQGKNTIKLSDVLVGEVWVSSGQSNMHWMLEAALNGPAEVAAATDTQIRFLRPERTSSTTRLTELNLKTEGWEVCSPATAAKQSAVAYFFARELRKELKVPIGLINIAVSGSAAEAWISREAIEAEPSIREVNRRWERALERFPAAKAEYDVLLAEYEAEAAQIRAGAPVPEKRKVRPNLPPGPGDDRRKPGGLFNAMLHPIMPYTIQGAIWYQGEANNGSHWEYEQLMTTLITNWRQHWAQGDFPFLFVQLSTFYGLRGFPQIRQAQTNTLKLPNTGMAVTIDIGEEKDIHPKNKQDVGLRLAKIALGKTYGKPIEYQGPTFAELTVEGNKALVRFDHAQGLKAKGDRPLGFFIAGEDREFKPANVVLNGPLATLTHPEVARPVAVRYAWSRVPQANLYNAADLPAVPFRTNDWDIPETPAHPAPR